MPRFTRSGRFHGVSIITEPEHVFLLVVFSPSPVVEPALLTLPASGARSCNSIEPERVCAAVCEAAQAANAELGSAFFPVEIAFVPSDTPRYDLFGRCATLLVRHLVAGGSFEAVEHSVA